MSRLGSGMNIVLVEPEIPPNTGNIGRLCSVTQTKLHLIEPLGFDLDDSRLKRAGMDYWQHVEWKIWESWTAFAGSLPEDAKLWFIETGGPTCYSDAQFSRGDYDICVFVFENLIGNFQLFLVVIILWHDYQDIFSAQTSHKTKTPYCKIKFR